LGLTTLFWESAKVEIFSVHQNSFLSVNYMANFFFLYLLNIALNFWIMNLTIDVGNTFTKVVISTKITSNGHALIRTFLWMIWSAWSRFIRFVSCSILSSVAASEKKDHSFLQSIQHLSGSIQRQNYR